MAEGSNSPFPKLTVDALDLEDSRQQDVQCPGPSSSCMTTKELQQHWRAVKQRLKPVKLLFEIPSSRIVEQLHSKYVVYRIVVIRSGSYDSHRVSVERRYSDFVRLHQQLIEDFSEELEEVTLPRKFLTGNFHPENIWERRLALRDYLAQLYNVRCARHSGHFLDFFTDPEQRQAHSLLRAGQFEPAVVLLEKVLELQEKLGGWQSPALLVPTLCALTVCHRDLEQPEEAFTAGHKALPVVRRYGLKRYRGPLLEMMVDLGYHLGRPVAQLQEELVQVKDKERGLVSFFSLKELVVQEFT
uniref:PX domain-containing protein n=1 Tax=Esox lucius TaxID=8010 RepID=A0AAY5K8N9_ESOLU